MDKNQFKRLCKKEIQREGKMSKQSIFILIICVIFFVCSCSGGAAEVSMIGDKTAKYPHIQNAYNYRNGVVPLADGGVIYSVLHDGIYYRDKSGKKSCIANGWYFNLQLVNDHLYALYATNEVYDPQYLKRIDLTSGEITTFPYDTTEAFISSNENILYYGDGGYYLSDWDGRDPVQVISQKESYKSIDAKAMPCGDIVIYDAHKVYLFDFNVGLTMIAERTGYIHNVMCRDNIFLILEEDNSYVVECIDKKGETIETQSIGRMRQTPSTVYDQYAMSAEDLHKLNKSKVIWDSNCRICGYYIVSIDAYEEVVYTFDDSIILSSEFEE